MLVKARDHKGPVGVVSGDASDGNMELAARVVARYCDADASEPVIVKVWNPEADSREITVTPFSSKEVKELAI